MSVVDARYYEATAPKSLSERVLVWAREAMYRDFERLMAPKSTDMILDVGVSDVINDGANMLEWRYPHRQNITAAGLGEGALFRDAYPEAAYRQIQPGRRFPSLISSLTSPSQTPSLNTRAVARPRRRLWLNCRGWRRRSS